MQSWDLNAIKLEARLPEILSSGSEARTILLDLEPGEGLAEHEVHERAWLLVVRGSVNVLRAGEVTCSGGPGLLVEIPPAERHEVQAPEGARLLLLLAPWPGAGHPGALSIREKLYSRRHAARRHESS